MAEVESTKYTSEKRDKNRVGAGRFNQPLQFHPTRLTEHEYELARKNKRK
jgi:hypothetical protein